MSRDNALAPDQRAVLELVLVQGRSYGELSELLGIPEREVHARAEAGLRALAGEPAPEVDSGRIADWLLGQQAEGEAEDTRLHLATNREANAWAAAASQSLADIGTSLPQIPEPTPPADPQPRAESAGGADPTSPASLNAEVRTPHPPHPESDPLVGAAGTAAGSDPSPREAGAGEPGTSAASDPAPSGVEDAAALPAPDRAAARPARSSKLGGAILLGVVVLIVAGAVAAFVLRGDDDDPDAAPQAQATPTATGEEAAGANDIVLAAANSSGARGIMRLFGQEDGSVQFAIAAENVPANRGREVYAVWFTREGGAPRRLGFAQAAVGQDGVLTTGGPQRGNEDEFPRWFATYDRVLVTRETNASAKRPGPAVLQGTLPGA